MVFATENNRERRQLSTSPAEQLQWQKAPWSYLLAAVIVILTTAVIRLLHADAALVSIPPIYVLAVQAVAVLFGSRAAVLASILSFLAFDWFFVDPKYQFTVRDPFEFVALCVFLVSAILVGQLTALFRARAEEAHQRELAATALARASWIVASEIEQSVAIGKLLQEMSSIESVDEAIVLVIDGQDRHECAGAFKRNAAREALTIDENAMQFVISTRQKIGWDESRHWHKALANSSDTTDLYLPVASEGALLGVLFIRLAPQTKFSNADRQVVTSLMNHIAVVLHRGKLLEAQAKSRALAETNRLKTALLQMVSHDFRSPLASIKASVSSLVAEEGAPIDASTQRGLLQAIELETDRLNRMVGNLLDLSKLEANVWQPQREPCSLAELVGSALDTFNAKDNERIHVSLPRTPAEISVDPVQLIQVLRNLLENALKYSQGPVELSAYQQGSQFTLEIADRGSGLPPGDEARIFEPFYRAKQHQESSLPGIGMGLAVCRGLVEAHGGTLRAMNRSGGGSLFCINLPMDDRKEP